jgi:hypothetical protein
VVQSVQAVQTVSGAQSFQSEFEDTDANVRAAFSHKRFERLELFDRFELSFGRFSQDSELDRTGKGATRVQSDELRNKLRSVTPEAADRFPHRKIH